MSTARLVTLYTSATAGQRASGDAWYATARATARTLAARHGVSLATSAGVIAALSPRVTWRQNVRLADSVLGLTYERGAVRTNLAKARAIGCEGHAPLSVLSGPKVRAFYRAMMGDETAGVVDVWMVRAMRIRALTAKAYLAAVRAMARAAAIVGTTVARLQAVVWTVVRGSAV